MRSEGSANGVAGEAKSGYATASSSSSSSSSSNRSAGVLAGWQRAKPVGEWMTCLVLTGDPLAMRAEGA